MTTVPRQIDTLVIAGKHDISLLRHFMQSQEMFSKLGGRTHLFIWRSEKYLLDQIRITKTVTVWYKDDIPGMVEDDFRNQMFIKMVANRFVETEWFWIADADYLICADLRPSDFFNEKGQPYWFYRKWDGGVPEQRWRSGAEKFMRGPIPYLFLDEPQFLMRTEILKDFGEKYDLTGVLRDNPMPADCLVYGAFAFENHHESYDWVDIDGAQRGRALCYKVNQRPPTYCELDERVSLLSLPEKKYFVFWSYWDQAERKMRQFLAEAAQRHLPPLVISTDDTALYVNVDPTHLVAGNFADIDGLYSDGWAHQNMRFGFYNREHEAIYVCFEVHTNSGVADSGTSVIATCNDRSIPSLLVAGKNELCIPIHRDTGNQISFQFSGGITEPNGQRTLFARLTHIRFK